MAENEDPIPALKEQLRQVILAELGALNPIVLARTLGIDEARMSNLEHGKIERFSIAKLIRLLAHINRQIEIRVVVTGPIPYPWYGPPRGPCLPTSHEWQRHGLASFGKSIPAEVLASLGKSIPAEGGKAADER